jgi:stage II sporulation protein D
MKGTFILFFALVVFAAASLSAQREPGTVDVRLFYKRPPEVVTLSADSGAARWRLCASCPWQVVAANLEVSARGEELRLRAPQDAAIPDRATTLEVVGNVRVAPVGSASFSVRGELRLAARQDRLALTARLSREEYVVAVLAGEGGGVAHVESLLAMSVAARTYAVRFVGRHRAEGFDFCDTTHCQDVRFGAVSQPLRAAVEATGGELLWYEGRPAAAFYHRDCGGTTEAARVPWPTLRASYLRQQQDPYCTARGRVGWQSDFALIDLRDALSRSGVMPGSRVPQTIRSVSIAERTPSGRVASLRLEGSESSVISAEVFRRAIGFALGWDKIRGDLYDLRVAGDRVVLSGYGAGHGVGLCQRGAGRMGELGRSYTEILSFYFPGTRVGISAGGLAWQELDDERLRLFSTHPERDLWILPVAARLLRQAEQRAGWSLTGRAQLRIYPSVEIYRDATGQPGWIAASTRGRTIRLQPLETLGAAQAQESTLAHELLHVLVEARARQTLPMWFREGLVLALESDAVSASESGEFSEVAALEQALAALRGRAELGRAYRAARSRVQQLIARYGRATVLSWLDSGLPREVR